MKYIFICAFIDGEMHSRAVEVSGMAHDDARRFAVYDLLGRAGLLDFDEWPSWDSVSYEEMFYRMRELCTDDGWVMRVVQ